MMNDVLIIAYGNPLRGDDGIGWHVAKYFTEEQKYRHCEVITAHQLLPEYAALISQADTVIFVDAAVKGIPGELMCTEIQPKEQSPTAFTHQISPEKLLSISSQFYEKTPTGILCTVTGQNFEFSTELSAPVQNALPELITMIEEIVEGSRVPEDLVV